MALGRLRRINTAAAAAMTAIAATTPSIRVRSDDEPDPAEGTNTFCETVLGLSTPTALMAVTW